jgi:hypothetical protein
MINCDCSCDEGERVRCSRVTIRTARKPHQCCECGEPIVPGQRYEDATGIDCDGDAYGYSTCLTCKAIREHYCPHGFIYSCLAEMIRDCLGFDYRALPKPKEAREIDAEDAQRIAEART